LIRTGSLRKIPPGLSHTGLSQKRFNSLIVILRRSDSAHA
jgi:hypothetical protein